MPEQSSWQLPLLNVAPQRTVRVTLTQVTCTDKGRMSVLRKLKEPSDDVLEWYPNIAHVYDVGEQDGIHFIAMEYVEGENPRAVLARGPLEPATVADVSVQSASALEEAHGRGIVHRDIKPAICAPSNTRSLGDTAAIASAPEQTGRCTGA
jgi:serine/threonine protein kinase